MQLMTLARWLARKAVKQEWRAQGRKVQYIPTSEITAAANLYLLKHRRELMKQAWEHPAARRQRDTLARRAVIEAIRQKGQRINSIAPAEMERLIAEYVKDHPELRVCGCF
jgi:hypothetical protein